jgi:chromosome segregation protein
VEDRVREAERRTEGLENGLEGLRAEALRAERAQLRLDGSRDRDADRRRAVSRLKGELDKVAVAVGRVESELDGLERAHSARKEELADLEGATERGRADLTSAAARRAKAAESLEAGRARRGRVTASRLDEEGALGEGELGRLAEVRERLPSFSPDRMRGRSAALLGRLGELREASRRLGTELDRRGGILSALIGQAEAEVRALRVSNGEGPGRRLYEVVRALPGYEAAVEAALGHLAGGVLAENLGEGIKYLTGDSPAERVVVRLDAEGVPESRSPPGKPLFECVEVLDDSYGGAVARLLGGIYVLEESHVGAAPNNGYVAVTREGIRFTRTSASRRTVEGRFVREARLAREQTHLHELKNRFGEDLYDLRETTRSATRRLEGLASNAEALDARVARADRIARLLAAEADRRARRAVRAHELRTQAEAELEEIEAKVRVAGEELRAASEAEDEAERTLAAAVRAVEPAYVAAREAAGRVARARAALEDGRGRAREISRRLNRLEGANPVGEGARLMNLARRATDVGRCLDGAVRERLGAARGKRSEATGRRHAVAERRAALAGEAGELALGLARVRSGAEALRGELGRAEEVVSGAEVEIFEEWGATLEAAREESERLPETADDERERARLARRLKGFGDVNLLAISQEGALRGRHEFVAAQRADAEAAAGELSAMIEGIDAEIAARFEATFREVRRSFAAIVPRMMEGASGELELSEEGVEIGLRLRRRGWRPLRVLSGGERALLALSFLFGIFLGQREDGPAAFCVLDEAEAALDDINLTRFLSVVDSYRADGQFLLVTHQKRTMAAADVLYGVTPDATGATTVVSKRLTGD